MTDYPIPLLGWPLCAYCLTRCGHEAECGAELDEPRAADD